MGTAKREHKTFTQNVSTAPRPRHLRDTDTRREVIRRPLDAAPRRVRDWS